MLKQITVEDVRRVAELAKAARAAQNQILEKVPEESMGEPKPVKGEHNPAMSLGFDALPADNPACMRLREAISSLTSEARYELRALACVGRGDYAAGDWERAVADMATQSSELTVDIIMDRADLHDHLMKALYELGLA